MDPTKAILITSEGETEFPIPDLKKGDPIPMVLIKRGKASEGKPDVIFKIDNAEVAKRFWQMPVYRETTALYI